MSYRHDFTVSLLGGCSPTLCTCTAFSYKLPANRQRQADFGGGLSVSVS